MGLARKFVIENLSHEDGVETTLDVADPVTVRYKMAINQYVSGLTQLLGTENCQSRSPGSVGQAPGNSAFFI